MKPTITVIEAVRNSLTAAARFNQSDMVAPTAILWTDADSQWEPLIGQLRLLMSELLPWVNVRSRGVASSFFTSVKNEDVTPLLLLILKAFQMLLKLNTIDGLND